MSQSRGILPELEREMTPAVRAVVEALFCRSDELTDRVGRLEQELKEHKRYSHPPKSAHAPSETSGSDRAKESSLDEPKRRLGGQLGSPKSKRALIPAVEFSEVLACQLAMCRDCGTMQSRNDPHPLRHQLTEIPPIVPVVIENQRHRLSCRCCRTSTCGELQEGVRSGITVKWTPFFGPPGANS